MRCELLHAKGNPFLIIVKVENYHIELLIQFDQFLWVVHAAPRHVGNVHKTVDSTEINKHTVRCDILNGTLQNLSFFKATNDDALLLFELSLNQCFVRDDDVFEFLVNFYNLEIHLFSNVDIEVADRLDVHL